MKTKIRNLGSGRSKACFAKPIAFAALLAGGLFIPQPAHGQWYQSYPTFSLSTNQTSTSYGNNSVSVSATATKNDNDSSHSDITLSASGSVQNYGGDNSGELYWSVTLTNNWQWFGTPGDEPDATITNGFSGSGYFITQTNQSTGYGYVEIDFVADVAGVFDDSIIGEFFAGTAPGSQSNGWNWVLGYPDGPSGYPDGEIFGYFTVSLGNTYDAGSGVSYFSCTCTMAISTIADGANGVSHSYGEIDSGSNVSIGLNY